MINKTVRSLLFEKQALNAGAERKSGRLRGSWFQRCCHRGTPNSWMVYSGKSQSKIRMMTGCTPHFRKPPDGFIKHTFKGLVEMTSDDSQFWAGAKPPTRWTR